MRNLWKSIKPIVYVIGLFILDLLITFCIVFGIHYYEPSLNYEIVSITSTTFTLITISIISIWISCAIYIINNKIKKSKIKNSKLFKFVNNLSGIYSTLTATFSYYMYVNGSGILPSVHNIINEYINPTLIIVSIILSISPVFFYKSTKNK